MARAGRRVGRSANLAFVVGLGVLTALVGMLVFAANASSGLPFSDSTTVKAAFTEIGSLREGDDVRVASTLAGSVQRIEPGEGQVVVTMKLNPGVTVYRNATADSATVAARSALGQKFVNLTPGTSDSGELGADDMLAARETRGAQEIGDLFPIFDEPTRAGLQSTLRETGGGLVGHQEDLHDLLETAPAALPALGTVSRTLAEDDGRNLTAMLRSADSLASRFQGREQQISDLLGSLDGTLDAVAVDRTEPLKATLDTAPAALGDVRRALDSLNEPLVHTESAMTALRPGGEALGQATPDLRGVLREAVQPLDKVPGVSDDAQPALEDLTVTATDLQPLSPRLAQTLDSAADPLTVLAPYAPEISGFFTNITSALSGHDEAGHWLRIMPILGTESVTGAGPAILEDPTVYRNPYPAPGQAVTDRRPLPITGERN
ncbi:mce related protein [Pseudonocardia autotrophica]|nr:mce related protein [Pseudonocardia autotrophica]